MNPFTELKRRRRLKRRIERRLWELEWWLTWISREDARRYADLLRRPGFRRGQPFPGLGLFTKAPPDLKKIGYFGSNPV